MSKKVVVFGGNGFIGSYVVEELLKKGYEVISADLSSSKYVDDRYFVKCDILDIETVNNLIKEADIKAYKEKYAYVEAFEFLYS